MGKGHTVFSMNHRTAEKRTSVIFIRYLVETLGRKWESTTPTGLSKNTKERIYSTFPGVDLLQAVMRTQSGSLHLLALLSSVLAAFSGSCGGKGGCLPRASVACSLNLKGIRVSATAPVQHWFSLDLCPVAKLKVLISRVKHPPPAGGVESACPEPYVQLLEDRGMDARGAGGNTRWPPQVDIALPQTQVRPGAGRAR